MLRYRVTQGKIGHGVPFITTRQKLAIKTVMVQNRLYFQIRAQHVEEVCPEIKIFAYCKNRK